LAAHSGGKQFELGKQKRDLSTLFTYACADAYLKPGAKLGFVITQALFKTVGAEVFRRFQIDASTYIDCLHVDDLSALQPFEGATNRTAVFVCRLACDPTQYPVPYVVWRKSGKSPVSPDSALVEVYACTARELLAAAPVSPVDGASAWFTAPAAVLVPLRKLTGHSDLTARAGCCTWLNSVYWVDPIMPVGDDEMLVSNRHSVGKIKVERVEAVVEADLVYPLVRGRDVLAWCAQPSVHIIYPHTAEGGWLAIEEEVMRRDYPKTYSYLRRFKPRLLARSGYRQLRAGREFYILGNTNADNFSPFKVLWGGQVATRLHAAVVTCDATGRPVLADQTAYYVPCQRGEEAFYLCALLNSAPVRAYYGALAYLHASANFLRRVGVPPFDDSRHGLLAELSQQAHAAAANGDLDTVAALETEIDKAAAKLWGITDDELAAIQDALAEMKTRQATSRSRARRPRYRVIFDVLLARRPRYRSQRNDMGRAEPLAPFGPSSQQGGNVMTNMPGLRTYPTLFSPFSAKGMRLRNRIVLPPMVTAMDLTSEQGYYWYIARAKGGAGLIILEGTSTYKFRRPEFVEGLRRIVRARRSGGHPALPGGGDPGRQGGGALTGG